MATKFIVLLFVLSMNAYSANNFDRMRCKGKLIHKGDSIQKVIKLCGKPDHANTAANQYVSYYKVSYHSVGRGKYFLLFQNGSLIRSEHVLYGASQWAWKLPKGEDD